MAFEMICEALKTLTGAELEFEHVFCCEKSKFIQVRTQTNLWSKGQTAQPSSRIPNSQNYLSRNFARTTIFTDAEDL